MIRWFFGLLVLVPTLWLGAQPEGEAPKVYPVAKVDWHGVNEFPPWFFEPLATVAPGEVLSAEQVESKLLVLRQRLERSGLVTSSSTLATLGDVGWTITVEVVEDTQRSLDAWGLVSQWGDRDFFGPGRLFGVVVSPWKQELAVGAWRPQAWPLDLEFRAQHQVDWRWPLSQGSSHETVALRTSALVLPGFSLFAEPFFEAQQLWSGRAVETLGWRSGVGYADHFGFGSPTPWSLNSEISLGQFAWGEGAGVTFARAGTAAYGGTAQWGLRLEPSLLWASGESPFLWVFSPFGGLVPGSSTGLWSFSAGVEAELYRSPGRWALSWVLGPRVVAAGWVDSQVHISPTYWGVGGLTKVLIGSWGHHGVSLEFTFDPVRRLWFWKVGLE